jgi:heme exporter protein D
MELGPHAAFIWAAYTAAALVLAALATWLIHDGRQQQRRLDELEARGLRRNRSGGPPREARTHAE